MRYTETTEMSIVWHVTCFCDIFSSEDYVSGMFCVFWDSRLRSFNGSFKQENVREKWVINLIDKPLCCQDRICVFKQISDQINLSQISLKNCSRCIVSLIITFWRRIFVHKYNYFSSFLAGNCVSDSSFKWMKNSPKQLGSIRVFLCLDSKCAYVSHFYPLEVVGRCDETSWEASCSLRKYFFPYRNYTCQQDGWGGGDNQYLIGFT